MLTVDKTYNIYTHLQISTVGLIEMGIPICKLYIEKYLLCVLNFNFCYAGFSDFQVMFYLDESSSVNK